MASTYNMMFIGKTGAGKTTLFNALKDFLGGVEFDCRTLVKHREGRKQGESDTRCFTKEYVQTNDPSVAIQFLDTPGLGDSEGVKKDKDNLNQILAAMNNVKDISAICFVFANNTNRHQFSLLFFAYMLMQSPGWNPTSNMW